MVHERSLEGKVLVGGVRNGIKSRQDQLQQRNRDLMECPLEVKNCSFCLLTTIVYPFKALGKMGAASKRITTLTAIITSTPLIQYGFIDVELMTSSHRLLSV